MTYIISDEKYVEFNGKGDAFPIIAQSRIFLFNSLPLLIVNTRDLRKVKESNFACLVGLTSIFSKDLEIILDCYLFLNPLKELFAFRHYENFPEKCRTFFRHAILQKTFKRSKEDIFLLSILFINKIPEQVNAQHYKAVML